MTTAPVDGGPDNQAALQLLRLGVPATLAARAARADMAARMAPELRVTDLETGVNWPTARQALDDALPWALLALPSTGPAAIALARQATADGRPPVCLLLRVEDEAALRAELGGGPEANPAADAEPDQAALPCPVAVLLTIAPTTSASQLRERTAELGGWAGLTTGELTVRLLAPDESLDAIARTVKEELRVWPA
jgi:hypothetical protein